MWKRIDTSYLVCRNYGSLLLDKDEGSIKLKIEVKMLTFPHNCPGDIDSMNACTRHPGGNVLIEYTMLQPNLQRSSDI